MSVEHPAYFLQDDLYASRHMVTAATNCRKASMLHSNLYPDSASTLVDSYSHVSHHRNATTNPTTFFQPAFLMLLFSRLIDAVIFTSAMAITAYNYWIGDLSQPAGSQQGLISAPAPSRTSSSSRNRRHSHAQQDVSPLVKARKRMTEEWAADALQNNEREYYERRQQQQQGSTYARPTFASMNKFHSLPAISADQLPSKEQQQPARSKHRSKSVDGPKQSQDEMLARMQTQLQNLIQEGEAALNSPAFDAGDTGDDDDILVPSSSRRRSQKSKHYHHKRYSSVYP